MGGKYSLDRNDYDVSGVGLTSFDELTDGVGNLFFFEDVFHEVDDYFSSSLIKHSRMRVTSFQLAVAKKHLDYIRSNLLSQLIPYPIMHYSPPLLIMSFPPLPYYSSAHQLHSFYHFLFPYLEIFGPVLAKNGHEFDH